MNLRNSVNRRVFLSRAAIAAGGAGLLAGCTSNSNSSAASPPTSQSSGNSKLYDVLKRKQLIVGTGTGNPPWHFSGPNGLEGFDIAMSQIVSNDLFGKPNAVQFVQESPDARIPNLLTNKVDVVFQFMTVNGLRAQQVEFTIPYYREGIGLLLKPGGKYKDYQALKAAGSSVKVSILLNAGAVGYVHMALPQAQVSQIDTQANVIQALDSGRVDAAAVDDSTVRWLTVTQPGRYADSGYSWLAQTYAAAVKPGDPVWLNFLNTCLHEAMTGVDFQTYGTAFKKYFGRPLPAPSIGFPEEYAPVAGHDPIFPA